MSPKLDRSILRRWFHLPAFAVIAVSATLVILGDRAADTWLQWKRPPAEPNQVSLVGRAKSPRIASDRIEWSVAITKRGKTEPAVAHSLAAESRRVIASLHDLGVLPAEIRILGASMERVEDMDGNAIVPAETVATQTIEVRSSRVAAVLDAYGQLAMRVEPSITVEVPSCWVADEAAVRRQIQDAMWADLRHQTDLARARLAGVRLERVTALSPSDVEVTTRHTTWSCTEGHTAEGTVGATFRLR